MSRTRFLTMDQLREALDMWQYLILIDSEGYEMGVNTSVIDLAYNRRKASPNSTFVLYRPCTFNEYISKKHPFV